MNFISILGFIFLTIMSSNSYSKTITLNTTDWCPYTCSSMANKGIVTEYVSTILERNGYQVEIKFLPWTRAVRMAASGESNGLLTGVSSEAKELIFTSTPTMTYRTCLFTANRKTFESLKISSITDLKKVKLGTIKGYSYGSQMDDYLAKNKAKNNVNSISGKDTLQRLHKLSELGRIDYFVEDDLVVQHTLKKKYYKAFCNKPDPFFLGLSPKYKNRKTIINLLNGEFSKNKNLLERIIKESGKSITH
ncbi:MAG: transporter substrate-binding domain-containing protein [Oligoflexia bacterium]|nr:transporter substrate-binding domain-containing protein [Oligoflexia bacterium]